MLDGLLTVALAPLLLWQGRRVRQRTLHLPEAAGAREGCLGRGQALRMLVLGDSSAAGVGVARQDAALAGQLAAQLSQHYQLSWQLLAETGMRCQHLLAQLEAVQGQCFDCVVLVVGVNDVTAGAPDKHWLADPQLLAADGFHPSQQAYAVWAEQLARAIQSMAFKAPSSKT